MLKLYGQYRSRAFRVAWLCAESNIAYEHVIVTIHADDATAKAAWYRELNPNARIPTIDDDGFIMWESGAINLYLAEKYKSALWPTDWAGKGRAMQWAFYISNDVEVPMIAVFQHRFRFPPEKRIAAIADQYEPILLGKLAVLEAALGRSKYFQGPQWGMADFMIGSVLYSLHEMGYAKLEEYPRLNAWLTESVARPAARKAIALRKAS